jgi:hypothetical protein
MGISLLLALFAGFSMAAVPAIASSEGCGPGSRLLYYSPHPLLDERTAPGFSDSLGNRMVQPLRELGYCLTAIEDYRTLLDTSRHGGDLVLHALVSEGPQTYGPGGFLVTLLTVRDLASGKLPEAISRPLVSLPLQRDDPAGLVDVLARKVAENLRRQYVAHVIIQSRPPEAWVRAASGLDGKTPVEWILPLGTLPVVLEKPGYLPLHRELDLSAPGQHNIDLHLAKRRFYHSRFIYPVLAFGATALASYALEEHYYAEYRSLGAEDLRNRPEVFGRTFRVAKTYERIAVGSLALATGCLLLSFRF